MWDVFCNVIDNYGDAGVCWRLARILRHEHGCEVRLWIDDLGALQKLHGAIDVEAARQTAAGIEVRQWTPRISEDPVEPGEVVIEAFGCALPESFIHAMAQRSTPPVWLNLEYLSAESWTSGCHKLASPHPRLPLTKYFFFPGFRADTGGLLREQNLCEARDRFQECNRPVYWEMLGLPPPTGDEIRISLFSYENAALPSLLDAWAAGSTPVTVLVPEGRVLPQLCAYFGANQMAPGDCLRKGRLSVQVLPFVEQDAYDRLLWACDFNFVRGEDSFVRAQWAGKPFVWHIYPQAEQAHVLKLEAFLAVYCAQMTPPLARAVRTLFADWNGLSDTPDGASAWADALSRQLAWRTSSQEWAARLAAGNELASELVKFAQAHVNSRPFVK
ncbi:MAG TPA: elongation factor P maturation arginine rhamnosyltransferase EarP [Burkholderiales bacterium]|nr:elongation factor P maturation arginine rhamnosyltransferase EarP [Burkholderiales bacterium]